MPRLLFLALAMLWAVPCHAQSPKLEDLRVSFASFGVIYYPHFIAKELGFYRDEGFNVDWIAMNRWTRLGFSANILFDVETPFQTS